MITVDGVLNGVARDENVDGERRHGGIRHNEAVAVVVKNQAAFYFITTREGRGLGTLQRVLGRFLCRRLLFRLAVREAVSSPWQFLDGAALFELGKHFEQGAIVGLP